MNSAILEPSWCAISGGGPPPIGVPKASRARRMTNSSTALRSLAFERKWCWTSPGETRAALATSRIEVAATPRAAKCRSAAFRMRAAAVRSESRAATAGSAIRPSCLRYDRMVVNDSMSGSGARPRDAASGLAFVILMSVALFLPGPPPRADDSIATITAILVEQRGAFLVGGYLAGLAALSYLWFLGSVWRHLTATPRDQTGLAITACSGGLLAVPLTLVGMAMFSGVAFKAAALGDPALVRALTDAGNTAIDTAKFGLAAFLLATCRSAAASGVLPRWLVGAGVAAAGLLIVSAVALFVDHGPFQFGGPVDLGGGIPAVLWIAALSLTMMRRSDEGDVE